MLGCSYSSSTEVMSVIFEKIAEVNGIDVLKTLLCIATDGDRKTCLMLCCGKYSSPEVMKLVIEKIVEVGGPDLLQRQLTTSTDKYGDKCLVQGCRNSSSPEVVKLLAVVLFSLDMFKEQYEKLSVDDKEKLKAKVDEICDASWIPDAESIDEVRLLIEEANFINVLNSNHDEHLYTRKSFLKTNEIAKKMLDSKSRIIIRAFCEPQTPLETLKLLFSYIKRIGGDKFLKGLLSKENDARESCLLSICLRHYDSTDTTKRLELFLNSIEEVGGEDFLAEQIAKIRQRDGLTWSCLSALCFFSPEYESLSLFVGKIFHRLECGRRVLREQLINTTSPTCLESILSHRLDTVDERKCLLLIMGLYSITGLSEDQCKYNVYSQLDEEKKKTLSRVCKVESGDWSRARSHGSAVGDVIEEIKKSPY